MAAVIDRGYTVYRAGEEFGVRCRIGGAEILGAEGACEAIQFAADAMAGHGGEVGLGAGRLPAGRAACTAIGRTTCP